MNNRHFMNYEYVADEFAKETKINEEKKEYFLRGVRWAIMAIEETIDRSGCHLDKSADAYLKQLTISDINKAIRKLKSVPEKKAPENE
ncbi:MAG: hypothetical protein JNL11_10795 [Bdellovibrionaceae bacterium]|nr:hypothetical protein [Pseudobdellovibrionaceae bacterium]